MILYLRRDGIGVSLILRTPMTRRTRRNPTQTTTTTATAPPKIVLFCLLFANFCSFSFSAKSTFWKFQLLPYQRKFITIMCMSACPTPRGSSFRQHWNKFWFVHMTKGHQNNRNKNASLRRRCAWLARRDWSSDKNDSYQQWRPAENQIRDD